MLLNVRWVNSFAGKLVRLGLKPGLPRLDMRPKIPMWSYQTECSLCMNRRIPTGVCNLLAITVATPGTILEDGEENRRNMNSVIVRRVSGSILQWRVPEHLCKPWCW
jgi:hypothetical protein